MTYVELVCIDRIYYKIFTDKSTLQRSLARDFQNKSYRNLLKYKGSRGRGKVIVKIGVLVENIAIAFPKYGYFFKSIS
jgi:hypothetical protein